MFKGGAAPKHHSKHYRANVLGRFLPLAYARKAAETNPQLDLVCQRSSFGQGQSNMSCYLSPPVIPGDA